jgi:hypothetical protein
MGLRWLLSTIDSTRYGGKIIPADFFSIELAEQDSFNLIKVYSLKQQKGQQQSADKKFLKSATAKKHYRLEKDLI